MHPLFWFILILMLAVAYGMRITSVVGRVQWPLMHWWMAVVMVGSLLVGTLMATRLEVRVPREAAVALHAAVLFVSGWLGLRYWFPLKYWNVPAAALAMAFVGLYYAMPSKLNNPMLALLALGMAVGGYYVSKRWMRTFYVLMAGLDSYLVWWTTLGDELAKGQTGLFPSSLIIGTFRLPFWELGTLDVVMGAMAVVGILKHRGIRRALLFVALVGVVTLGLVLLPHFLALAGGRFERPPRLLQWVEQFPYLVVLAPLVWLFLAGKSNRTS